MKILTVGSATEDVFLLDRDDFTTMRLGSKTFFNRLTLGSKVRIDHAIQATGGGGTNSAVTFARAGFSVHFLGSIGDDLAGQAVLKDLKDEGVSTKYLRVRKNEGTGYSVMLLAPNGERTALVVKGASRTFAGINFNGIIREEKPDWIYVTTLSGELSSLSTIVRAAGQVGARAFVNPGDSEIAGGRKLLEILSKVHILSLNTEEAEKLLKSLRVRKTWQKYLALGGMFGASEGVIITDGPRGATFSDGKKLYKVPSYGRGRSIDRTGAGDAFGSGFLSEYIRSKGDVKRALLFAAASSSSVVMRIGAKEGILAPRAKLKKLVVSEKEIK